MQGGMDRQAQEVLSVVLPGRRRVMYVRNQKAASRYVARELKANRLFPTGRFESSEQRPWANLAAGNLPANASDHVFTVVREPIETALTAYSEVLKRNLRRPDDMLRGDLQARKLAYLTYNGRDNFERLRLYLDAVYGKRWQHGRLRRV